MKKCPSCDGKLSETNFYKFKAGNDVVCEFCGELIEREETKEKTVVVEKKGSGLKILSILLVILTIIFAITGIIMYSSKPSSPVTTTTAPPTTPQLKNIPGAGYELFFDGKLVSGPDAQYYSFEEAKENCEWNMLTKEDIKVECKYDGVIFNPSTSLATTKVPTTTPPTTMSPSPKSLSNYDAIELLPLDISGYTTEERNIEINKGCITTARGRYLVYGTAGDSVAVFVCHSPDINRVSAGKGVIPSRYSEFVMGPRITLYGDIQGYYAYDVVEHMSLIWWTQGEFYFNVLAASDSGVGDTKNMATYVANALIQNQ